MLGLQPGPFLFRDHSQFVWAVIASMYIGNVLLLAMNMPLIGIFVKLLKVPYKDLMAIILTLLSSAHFPSTETSSTSGSC